MLKLCLVSEEKILKVGVEVVAKRRMEVNGEKLYAVVDRDSLPRIGGRV